MQIKAILGHYFLPFRLANPKSLRIYPIGILEFGNTEFGKRHSQSDNEGI